MKKENKKLFAIYKNNIHLGNSYGETTIDAIKFYLLQSYLIQIPNITIEEILEVTNLNNYKGIEAIENIHYFRSKYIKDSEFSAVRR